MQGKLINGFEIKRLLGTGGMAEVWLAENKIGKKAAVKLLLPKFCADEVLKARFLTEAKIMVGLNHPNIRQVYDYGEVEGRPAIIMEYLEGDDLRSRMKNSQHFTEKELEKWWNQLVDALNYTHAKEIVHRDIKPSNIFVDTEGNVKLLDFGIAKVRENISATQTGQKLGTLMYMSPEQVRNSKGVGPESDAYSVAVTFVHLLTGKAPYDSDSSDDFEISELIVYKPLDLTGLPKAWRVFLKPYLAKDPADRPALRAFEVAPDVPDNEDDETVSDKVPDSPHSRPDDKPKGNNLLWILLGVVAALILLIVLLWSKKSADPDTEAFQNCQTVGDYRDYIDDYGTDALHYAEAMDSIQRFVADSAQRVQDSLAQVQAERVEDEAYRKCTTVKGCDNYLKTYPNGRYAEQVRAKKAELEQQTTQQQTQQQTIPHATTGGNVGNNGSSTGHAIDHEYVDLGLPSGTLWATCNVGASKPEEYGNYYAWGETTTKSKYDVANYKYAKGRLDKLTKYCNRSDHGNNGMIDNLTTLQAGDDPATANWGDKWHTPTENQWKELLANTIHNWTTLGRVSGMLFTAKNGQSIFLPVAGYRWYKVSRVENGGSHGIYWSNTLNICSPEEAKVLIIMSPDKCEMGIYMTGNRYFGFSVRSVCEKQREQQQTQEQTQQPASQNTPTTSGSNSSTTGSANGHEYVDLGMPSGTLWATCNVGANKPEGYGNYYAWGETSTKSTYNWDTYKYANGDDNMTKYCNKSNYGKNGFTDNLTTLQSADDPAAANWGSGWQTPSKVQWEELLSNTTNQWTTRNGVIGMLFTSKKNSRTLFLPAAGQRWDDWSTHAGSDGNYWSRSLNTDCANGAWFLHFSSDDCDKNYITGRYYGLSVRPVR